MKPIFLLAAIPFMAVAGMSGASAAGCLEGAAMGGVAGHLAGHGVLGAAAGCAVGHHEAKKNAKPVAQPRTTEPAPLHHNNANPVPSQ